MGMFGKPSSKPSRVVQGEMPDVRLQPPQSSQASSAPATPSGSASSQPRALLWSSSSSACGSTSDPCLSPKSYRSVFSKADSRSSSAGRSSSGSTPSSSRLSSRLRSFGMAFLLKRKRCPSGSDSTATPPSEAFDPVINLVDQAVEDVESPQWQRKLSPASPAVSLPSESTPSEVSGFSSDGEGNSPVHLAKAKKTTMHIVFGKQPNTSIVVEGQGVITPTRSARSHGSLPPLDSIPEDTSRNQLCLNPPQCVKINTRE
eukprot:TRINITY_DN23402_c0_g1_i1.p1 TRINITY_DN23402_c0_g1~~TRINITY_DN23402_c0_g1_i1.p1  ORF type:complete len:259 (-),score=25.54 TRINITY_DN23402_c0_g1_i1:185-961(-)